MTEKALEWAATALSTPPGEPVTDPTDLPDTLDELLALANALAELVTAVRQLRGEVEAKAAAVLGPGRSHRYGDQVVRWGHAWTWKAEPEAVRGLIRQAAAVDPGLIVELFNPNDVRKTGIEKVAKALGIDPDVAVQTSLYRKWGDTPGLRWKPADE